MKILFFGSTKGIACSLHYYTSFVRLGHEALPFDPEYFAVNNPAERVLLKLRKAPLPSRIDQVGKALVDICDRNRFDLVFNMAENFLGRETIEEIRKTSDHPPLFAYHSHDNNFSSGVLKPPAFFETLADYDCVFTTKSQNVIRYREHGQKNAHYLPSAYEPTVHRPIRDEESAFRGMFDATFIGTFDRSRPRFLDAVGWDRLNVWGSDWTRWEKYAERKDRIDPRPIYYFEFADVISHSRCALGLLREEAQDRHTQRTFEIPACGALQIAPRNDEILSYFEEGKEILCFDSLEELRDKVDYCLTHETERARIARRSHERCLRDRHTYQDRVAEMLRIATRGTNKRREAV